MRLWRVLRAVVWSCVGVRRSADAARDLQGVRPQTVFVAAVVVVIALVIGIASLVRMIVGSQSGTATAIVEARAPPSSSTPVVPHGPAMLVDSMQERMR